MAYFHLGSGKFESGSRSSGQCDSCCTHGLQSDTNSTFWLVGADTVSIVINQDCAPHSCLSKTAAHSIKDPVFGSHNMSSVTLQNNVRLRVILVLAISLLVQLGRNFVSDSVHKATSLLEFNYIFYGLLLLCSCIPSKIAWYIAGIALSMATVLGGAVLALGGVSTLRCVQKSGCVQTIPGSLFVLALVAVQCLLDAYQTWNIYLIIRIPYFVASSTQRMVILFSWALPFAVVTNVVLLSESQWSVWVSPPLVAMPIIIIMIQSAEYTLIGILITISIASNVFAMISITNTLAQSALIVQAAISIFGAIVMFIPSETYVIPPKTTKDVPVLPVNKAVATQNNTKLRQRKSQMLHF